MKRKIILICVLLIISLVVAGNYKSFKQDEKEHKVKESNIAIMVYDDESDSYIKQSSIPKGAKYSLNEELTKCEVGGTVTNYSKANGTLSYKLNEADQCYVYFDVDNTPSYAIYSETDNSLIFYKNNDIVGTEYNGRVVTAKYDDIEEAVYAYSGGSPSTPWYEHADSIKIISVANEITPINTANWFCQLKKVENINLTNLNTKYVINMEGMFDKIGEVSSTFEIYLGDKFDTSNVTNMSAMFQTAGSSATNFTLDLGDKFVTSKVTDMSWMFYHMGKNGTIVDFNLGDKFDTSQVTNMEAMFQYVGRLDNDFTLNLGDKFDTSKVINMQGMFANVGFNNTAFTLNLGDKFDTSKVVKMWRMFAGCGANNWDFELDLSSFIINNNCDLRECIKNCGGKIILGKGWASANIVSGMFICDTQRTTTIVNAPTNILNYDFASDNRVVTFTTI